MLWGIRWGEQSKLMPPHWQLHGESMLGCASKSILVNHLSCTSVFLDVNRGWSMKGSILFILGVASMATVRGDCPNSEISKQAQLEKDAAVEVQQLEKEEEQHFGQWMLSKHNRPRH